ncbi:F-box/LRR-repeat protein 12-like [Papaver somniferum]|uniref:F-box/LRR-repeat protein 12-like n=1 Tax=Papaver somniferum TaxID=3469 RepID=UPI000E6FF9E1|nr:F-box/LRR-repeat protein 12-like [Papaver somniferum]
MSLLSSGKYNQGFGKIPTAKAVQQGTNNNNDGIEDDGRPCETLRTSYLPDDCLNLIIKCLKTRDRNSFGLTCRQWLNIQNNNQEFLAFRGRKKDGRTSVDDSFPIVLYKLLSRFQHLKYLSLSRSPKITDSVTSKPPFCFESKVQDLRLCYCIKYSDIELSIMFSWFPRLRYISLSRSYITDKGLEALARCCSSLKQVQLWGCQFITDSGIRFLLQNCRELHSLCIGCCTKITGIGFLNYPKTLTRLEASQCRFKSQGVKAIVSGGGIEHLCLLAPYEASINTEALVTISKGCPLLKELILENCENVKLLLGIARIWNPLTCGDAWTDLKDLLILELLLRFQKVALY